MSVENRIFLDGKGLKNEKGSSVSLGLTFPSEKDFDEALWFDPEHADVPLRYLLKVHGGEITPALSRIALKAMAIPLFTREFQGEETTDAIQADINTIALRNSVLLDAYLDCLSDETIDQTTLHQAINNSVVFQLDVRSFRSKEQDDITLLPIGPEEYHQSPILNFTVLRRKMLGRAHLIVSEQTDAFYRQAVNMNAHRIRIKPSEIVGPDNTFVALAEALVAEQQLDVANVADYDLITVAAGRLFTKIHEHFGKKEA